MSEAEWQSFHPMDNSASTCINQDGVAKIKELSGKAALEDFQIVDFANLSAAATTDVTQQKGSTSKPKKASKKLPKPTEDIAQNLDTLKLENKEW